MTIIRYYTQKRKHYLGVLILKHSCNCKIKNECPLGNKCNLDDIINQANISTKEKDTNGKVYIGMTNLNWKFRYYNHLQSFKHLKIKLPYLGITDIW